ncbi:MAG: hypothetical protein AB4372_37595 [Xenococcus sp. (in: cyanobacteria)]
MYELFKDLVKGTYKLIRVMLSPILEGFHNIFRKTTCILGPSKAGKTTLQKILRGQPYYIGEYNHTNEIITINEGGGVVTYKVSDQTINPIKMKVKKDVPGEDFEAWKQIIVKDRPKGIILIVDLVGLVDSNGLRIDSDEQFTDFEACDPAGNKIIVKTTPKKKFQEQVRSFQTIYDTCTENGIMVNGVIVFLNKCDLWLKQGIDLVEIIYLYRKAIDKQINLTMFAKNLGLKSDVFWEATSMVPDYKTRWFEPAILKFSSIYK